MSITQVIQANEGGWAGAREKGKVRMEEKEYVVVDGDVMLFKFGG